MKQIEDKDFAKVEMKAGEIVEAKQIEGTDKLVKMKVDLGEGKLRQVVSGIRPWYKCSDLKAKRAVFVVNLPTRIIRGHKSEAMILTAIEGKMEKVSIIILDKKLANGSGVC